MVRGGFTSAAWTSSGIKGAELERFMSSQGTNLWINNDCEDCWVDIELKTMITVT